MASIAVIKRKGYCEMTYSTKFLLQNIFHFKMLCSFLFNKKNVRVAVSTIQ